MKGQTTEKYLSKVREMVMYTLAVMLVWNRELKVMNRSIQILHLSQRKTVWRKVHPLVVGVGITEPRDGEGEGGEDQVDGVHHGQDQK